MKQSYKLVPMIIIAIVVTGIISAIAEQVTLTTYYPSPQGNFDEVQCSSLAVGADAIASSENGVANFQGLANDIANADSAEGDLYYNNTDHEFKYYAGATDGWKAVGGGGNGKVTLITSLTERANDRRYLSIEFDDSCVCVVTTSWTLAGLQADYAQIAVETNKIKGLVVDWWMQFVSGGSGAGVHDTDGRNKWHSIKIGDESWGDFFGGHSYKDTFYVGYYGGAQPGFYGGNVSGSGYVIDYDNDDTFEANVALGPLDPRIKLTTVGNTTDGISFRVLGYITE